MAGGIWDPNALPVLPGMYANFQAAALSSIGGGVSGTVIMPVKADWGPIKQFVSVSSETDVINTYTNGTANGATAYTSLKLALMGQPKEVLAYRLASATAAKASLILKDSAAANALTLTATYEGVRGNGFTATVATDTTDNTVQDLKLYEGTTLLATYSGKTIQDIANSINADGKFVTAVVDADGAGTLTLVTNAALAGGDSGIAGVAEADYSAAFTAFESQFFNAVTLDGNTDAATQTALATWVTTQRNNGVGVVAVMGGSAADDKSANAVTTANSRSTGFMYEGIVNVGVGGMLDGVEYGSAQVACYIAGLIVGQKLSQSTTYAKVPFDDVNRRWSKTEQATAITNGTLLLVNDGRQVKVLMGVNTLSTLRSGQNNSFKKIRGIRTMDKINADLLATAEDNYIGKVENTDEGRLALVGACEKYFETMVASGVLADPSVGLDPDYYGPSAQLTPGTNQVFLKWSGTLTDTMEQIFGTFTVAQ